MNNHKRIVRCLLRNVNGLALASTAPHPAGIVGVEPGLDSRLATELAVVKAALLVHSHGDIIKLKSSLVGSLRHVLRVVAGGALGDLAVGALVGDHAIAAFVAALVAALDTGGASARGDVLDDLAAAALGLAEGGLAAEAALVAPLVDLQSKIRPMQ